MWSSRFFAEGRSWQTPVCRLRVKSFALTITRLILVAVSPSIVRLKLRKRKPQPVLQLHELARDSRLEASHVPCRQYTFAPLRKAAISCCTLQGP